MTSDVSSTRFTIAPENSRKWGEAGLIGLFIAGLGVIVITTLKAPGLVKWLPFTFVGVSAGFYLFAHPRLNFIVWLGGIAVLFSSEPGLQIHEVAYGLYFYAYLAHWYCRRLLLYRSPFIRTSVDVTVMLWLVLGIGLGILLGIFFSADPIRLRGEAIALTMIAIYFPIKEITVKDRYGPLLVLGLILWIGLFISIDNIINTRQAFTNATMLWEIADVRFAGRELLLVFPCLLIFAILPILSPKNISFWVAVGLAILLLIGLILTKSRAFWVQAIVGAILLVLFSPSKERNKLIAWGATAGIVLFVGGMLFLSSYFDLIITGISSRFASLGQASVDLSLINRFVETETVWQHVRQNPILGYGFGRVYSFFDIIALATITRSYSHIGLVAVLYKFGLWGAILVGYSWLGSIFHFFRSKSNTARYTDLERALFRGILACSISMALTAMTTSVFFEDEKLSAFIMVTALGMGIFERRSDQLAVLSERSALPG